MMARLFFLLSCLLAFQAHAFGYGTPIASDSRIKTFVYNENDVYRLLTHYGFQMNIEFGNKEEIETISVGDRTGWQIIPAGNRLFVRGMEDKAHTNMTVVTNRHAYQFDLYAAPPGQQGWDELVYVVRFYYPEEQDLQNADLGGTSAQMMMPSSPPPYRPQYQAPYNPAAYGAVPYGASPVSMTSPVEAVYPPAALTMAAPVATSPAPLYAAPNYNYSFTGEQSILPTQMYDDGQRTFLVFMPSQMLPQVSVVGSDRQEQPAAVSAAGQTVVVPGVYARLMLRVGGSHACVYNDNLTK